MAHEMGPGDWDICAGSRASSDRGASREEPHRTKLTPAGHRQGAKFWFQRHRSGFKVGKYSIEKHIKTAVCA